MNEEILRFNVPALASGRKAAQEQREREAIRLLRESPFGRKVCVASEECDGIVPVTVAGWLSAARIVISDFGVTRAAWDPVKFEREINDRVALSRPDRRKAALVARACCEGRGYPQ